MTTVNLSPSRPTETSWYSRITSLPGYVGKVVDWAQRNFAKSFPFIPVALGLSGKIEKRPLLETVGASCFCYGAILMYLYYRKELPLAKEISQEAEQIIAQVQKGRNEEDSISALIEKTTKIQTSTRIIREADNILGNWKHSHSTLEERAFISEKFKSFVKEIEACIAFDGLFALFSGGYAAYTAFWAFQKGGGG